MSRARDGAAAAPRLSIVVADDEPDTVRTLAILLEMEGHEVYEVYSGKRVTDMVLRLRPDVCILDIDMPGHSGYAIADELRSRCGDECPTLIAISGKWYGESDQMLAKTVGFDHFVQKPA